ncbi:MAG: VCBS repeat-containing protein, partial [Cytophagaceae bacterium]
MHLPGNRFLHWRYWLIGLFGLVIRTQSAAQFTRLGSEQTGISFENRLTETEENNVIEYDYFYNGAGIAVGDLNNDGLPDLYFTGNMIPDKLYLNKGKLRFEDVSGKAGVGLGAGWKTGVTLVDINADGWLDIYVCYSGHGSPEERRNRLYINNHTGKGRIPTFTEQAAAYGLDLPGYSTQAVFLDYDKDGDLDCFLLNHNVNHFTRFDPALSETVRDEFAGDYLFRNNGPQKKFEDVSEECHIKGSPHMLPADNRRQKLLQSAENYELYQNVVRSGFGHQYMRNMLQLNNGNTRTQTVGKAVPTFSEIGQLAGISNTDWSWAPLAADFDNDGWKDLYVSNGFLRDYTNMDFLKFYADSVMKASHNRPAAMMDMVRKMPSTATTSYIFRNRSGDVEPGTSPGRLTFENKVAA